MDFRSSKRASVRKERKKVQALDVKLLRLRGDDIKVTYFVFVNVIKVTQIPFLDVIKVTQLLFLESSR
jgi:predicted N-acyltransferase